MRLETQFKLGWLSETAHKYSESSGVRKVSELTDEVDIEYQITSFREDTDPYARTEKDRRWHKLMLFAQRLQQTSPSWKFARRYNDDLYVYRDGDLYSFGTIGYGDYLHTDSGKSDYKYTFWCPNVRNERYNAQDNNYHMSQAKDMEVAARKCTSYMRPFYLHEFFHKHYSMITDQRKKALGNFLREYNESKTKIREHPELLTYLMEAYKNKEIPLWSDDFSNTFEEYISAYNAHYEAESTEHKNVLQVYIRTNKNGRKHFELRVYEYDDDKVVHGDCKEWVPQNENMQDECFGFIEDLPEDIARQIAALDFLNKEGKPASYRETNWQLGQGLMAIKGELYYLALNKQ